MKKFLTKKVVVSLSVIAVLATAVAAYAYFTSSGSGTGSASVGSSSEIALSGSTVSDLFPGGADVPVTVTLDNSAGGGNEHIGTVSGTVEDNGLCLGSWFVVDDINYDATLDAGATDTADTNVRMTDTGTDQDACQGKTMTIDWSSN